MFLRFRFCIFFLFLEGFRFFWGLHDDRDSLFVGAFAAEAGDDHDDDDYVLNSKLLNPERAPLGCCCGHV